MLSLELFLITAGATLLVILGLYGAKESGLILEPFFKWICPQCFGFDDKNKLPLWVIKPMIGCIYCMPSLWSFIGIVTTCLLHDVHVSFGIVIQWFVMTCGLSFIGGFFWKLSKNL